MYKGAGENNYWISFSDLMTGLMIIFLFIAINYIVQVIGNKFVSQEIYNELKEVFEEEIEEKEIELSPNGTVRFRTKKDNIYFEIGEHKLEPEFVEVLNEFIPRYLDIITNEEHLAYISEIRIEGHTDTIPPTDLGRFNNSYSYNLWLSSERAASVLRYIRASESYQNLPEKTKDRLDFLFTANGLSFSRALNSNGELVYKSKDKKIHKMSRRVEFRVVTSNEKLLEKIVDFNNE